MIFPSSFSSHFLVPIILISFAESLKLKGEEKERKKRREGEEIERGKKQEIKEKERKKNRKKSPGIRQSGNPQSRGGYLHGHYYATGSVLHEWSYFHELSYLIFKRLLLARHDYCSTLQMKPRLQKIQLLGSGSHHQLLQRAEPIFVPLLIPKAMLLTPMEGKISKVNRLAFLYTDFKVRHLIIIMFEMTSSFPP